MYSFVLGVQVVVSLLVCLFVLVAQGRSGGGTRDFAPDTYSANALMAPKHVNALIIKALTVLGFLLFMTSTSLMVLDKHEADRLVRGVVASKVAGDVLESTMDGAGVGGGDERE